MNKMKNIFMLVLIAAVISLGLTGCKGKSKPPAKETQSEETPSKETPAKEHPAGEHPK